MSHHGDHGHRPSAGAGHPGYEPTDAKAMPVVIFAVIMAIFTVGCFIVGFFIYRVFEMGREAMDPAPHPMAVKASIPEGMPRLQIIEAKDLAEFKAAQDEKVRNYAWVDRQAGTVRIPVDKAVDRVLAEGGLESRE